jgi:prepilin-type N-terminal cleavage/methylation domain-containing protein
MSHPFNKRRGGFTLVEIMIVVAIIAILATIAVRSFVRARKRAQATRVLNELRMIDSAVDQYAIENNKGTGEPVVKAAWTSYLKKGSTLYSTAADMFGRDYGDQVVDTPPGVPHDTFENLSDVAPASFFSPYRILP